MRSFLVIACFATLSLGHAHAAIVFEDAFNLDPGANGWVEDLDLSNTAVGEISTSLVGTAAIFDKTSGSGRIEFSITRTISTVGFENITADLTAFQSASEFEATDFLSLEYNSGAGFTSLVRDVRVWNGVEDSVGETLPSLPVGNVVPTSTGALALPTSANDNATLQFRIIGSTNANAEDYLIDNFRVEGSVSAVPEPSSVALLLVAVSGIVGRRRR
jgi:hypothetical protein